MALLLCAVGTAHCQCFHPVAPQEACDGRDDDGDGVADNGPDGGPLMQACPLTRGVCSGAVSRCVAGQWTRCEYGSEYQRTETRCDGLDNDCDGVIDQSWTRELMSSDAGIEPQFTPVRKVEADFIGIQFVMRDGGFGILVPNGFISVTDELSTVEFIQYPSAYNQQSVLLPRGEGWVHVSRSVDFGSSLTRLRVHRLQPDFRPLFDADGGWSLEAELLVPHSMAPIDAYCSFAAITIDGGVEWAAVLGDAAPLLIAGLVDGGISTAAFDAGYQAYGDFCGSRSLPMAGALLLGTGGWTASGPVTNFYRVEPPTLEPVLLSSVAHVGCWPGVAEPLLYACDGAWPGRPGISWFSLDGGVALADTHAWLMRAKGSSGPIVGFVLPDAGATVSPYTYPVDIAILRDGGLIPYVRLGNETHHLTASLGQLGPRLQVATWAEGWPAGMDPAQWFGHAPQVPVDRYLAKFVCAPDE